MDGVTIIQTIPQYGTTWGWDWGLIALFFVFAFGVSLIYMGIQDGDALGLVLGGVVFCIMTVLGMLAIASQAKQVFTHNQYQVIVDDSVSMTEFMNRYDVIEKQGITYIVEER